MRIQAISAYTPNNQKNNNISKHCNNATQTAFQGEDNSVNSRNAAKAIKALALSSAIGLSPAVITSCEKEEIGWCDHPNHVDPPLKDSTDVDVDTIYSGKTYEVPGYKMPRYKVSKNDTTYLGQVTFSKGIVHVPTNAHKAEELKTLLNFIDLMGLKSTNINKEYVATKAFDYNQVPAQIAWVDEKAGTVNQLLYNGYANGKYSNRMNLVSILPNDVTIERQYELIPSGKDKLLINIFDKDGENKLGASLLALSKGNLYLFNSDKNGKFKLISEFNPRSSTSVFSKDVNGEVSKLSNFHINTVISEEK